MVNNIAATGFFTMPAKDDLQTILSKRLEKFEKLPLLDQYQAKAEQYKKHYADRLYA